MCSWHVHKLVHTRGLFSYDSGRSRSGVYRAQVGEYQERSMCSIALVSVDMVWYNCCTAQG